MKTGIVYLGMIVLSFVRVRSAVPGTLH